VTLLHAALYRLREPRGGGPSPATEVARVGLRDRRAAGAILLVEWGEDAVDALGGGPAFVVSLAIAADGARTATVSGMRAADIAGDIV
jgi:tRNA threonylcarbamoyladenosine biosynthesis protein TsaE